MNSKFLLYVVLLISALGYSQNFDVGGTVKDADSGIGIPSVNVVSSTGKSASTDLNGKFMLKDLPAGSTLTFSYLGYKESSVKVTKTNESLTVSLKSDVQSLEQVVVIGYGSQKKKDITGAVGLVDSKTIDKLKPIKIEQALTGTLAGVTVTSQSGAPGAGLDIRIRGVQSNLDNSPLYIVDGNISDPSILNPSDIESITVLKDAQAAIYGVRGANGVVIIKTKMGKRNSKTTFSYNSYTGSQSTTKKLSLLNATEYALLLNESYANGGRPLPYPNVNGIGSGTDWQNEVFDSAAPMQSHDISVSGGSEKINYALSGSDLTQSGIVGSDKSGFKRNTLMMSINADLNDKLKLQTTVNYVFVNRKSLNENGLGSVLFNAVNTPATLSPRDVNGNFTLVPSTPGFGIEVINPLAQIDNTYNDYNGKRISGVSTLDYAFLKDFSLTTRIGANTFNSEGKTFNKIVNYGGKVFDVTRSSVNQNAINDNSYVFDMYLTYKKVFLDNHNVTAVLGTSNSKVWGNGLFATGYDIPNNSWDFADISLATGATTTRDVGSYTYDDRLNSYFLRMQYDYSGKYLFSGMLRRDSSTKFGPDNAVAYFPSATAGWIASKEGFMDDFKAINFMKVRASYGVLGNDKIPSNGYVGYLNGEGVYVFDNTITTGVAIGALANPGLKWENARKFDVGVDLKFLSNKLDVTYDYFIETREDLLIAGLPVSGITGVGGPGGYPPTVNAGSTRNVGHELSMGWNQKIGNDFSFSVNYNVTTIANKVTNVNNGTGVLQSGSFGVGQQPIARMEKGYSIGYFYGLQTDGIFQNQAEVDAHPSQLALGAVAQPGDIRYKDVNGDGVINLNDRTKVGSPLADYTMGFNVSMNYKNFDFAAYSYASLGNDMVRNYERSVSDLNKMNYNLGRWTGEGTSNAVPRVTTEATTNNLFSDYFVEDASFWRIQNIQLGYTLANSVTQQVGITKLRLYTSMLNPFTFTKYRGFDPTGSNGAAIGGGIDYGFYPSPKVFILGLNLNF
ncbi:MAG: TonB-dependent receptor [Flavobacterium sp.]|nr:TonB-dependent receptor [Flavobacterium sp.]